MVIRKNSASLLVTTALFLLLASISVLFAQSNPPPLASSTHSLPGEIGGEPSALEPVNHPSLTAAGNEITYLPLVIKPTRLHPFEQEVLDLVNQERGAVGCGPLMANDKLIAAARGHSDDMAYNDFFSHTGSDGSSAGDRIERQGYSWSRWGENIAAGYATPGSVMNGWMNSAGHKANILNCNFAEIGIGYTYLANDAGSVNYHRYWTQDFGTPR